MHFLLSTLPERTRNNYLEKLSVSIRFWREKGGCLPDETIAKLQKAGIRIEIGGKSAYRTDKRPVRMEYLDDIDLPEFSRLPTFKRICICILKNDHACKYMGFSPNKSETQRRNKIMEKYESLLQPSDKSNVPEPCDDVRAVPVEKGRGEQLQPQRRSPARNETAGTVDLGGRLHDAVRLLLRCRKGSLRTGGRLPPLPGAQAVETHLRTGEGPAARGGDRKGHLEPHGLDHPPQPGTRHTQRRADERNRRRS